MGTGILRMQKLLAEAGLPPLKYEFSEAGPGFVRAIFYRYPGADAVTPPVTPPASGQVEGDRVRMILVFCSEPKSREEIQTHLGLKDKNHFIAEILSPLLKSGLLVPTIPDKPNSPRQKYIVTKRAEIGKWKPPLF
jgi:ATP-dependent DNA helicase RecG